MNFKRVGSFGSFYCVAILCLSGCLKNESVTQLPPINGANNKVTGFSAKDFLTATNFTSLKIEIQYMPGFKPDPASVDNLTAFLSSLIHKPVGISVTQQQINTGGKTAYSTNDIASIEQNNRREFNSGSQLSVYVLVADGQFSDANVLGVAYRNTSICLFGKTIFDNSGGIGQASRTKLLTTVAEHEFGHLFGLVDLGTPMVSNHRDAVHGHHCDVQDCLMYYTAETTDLLGFLVTGNIPVFDSQCFTDLEANGGK